MAGSQGASVADSCQVTYGRPSLLAALLLPLFAWSQQGSLKISTPSVPPQIERDARIPQCPIPTNWRCCDGTERTP